MVHGKMFAGYVGGAVLVLIVQDVIGAFTLIKNAQHYTEGFAIVIIAYQNTRPNYRPTRQTRLARLRPNRAATTWCNFLGQFISVQYVVNKN